MLQRNNEKLLSIGKMIQLQKSDLVVLHDEVNLGYDVLLFGLHALSYLEVDG